MDVAVLGLRVDSSGVRRATGDLLKFGKSAGDTQKVAVTLGRALGGLVSGMVAFAASGAAIQVAREFNAALAETSTLLGGAPQQMDKLGASAKRLAGTFGGPASAQVRAYYQAISAGASSVEEATRLLEVSNRLAVGGVTDVTTATGALSSAVNAYGKGVLSYQEVSDALFVGMKQGITTVGELASSLGKVTPLAASAGVSFDELVASVSALTKGGISTTEAVTGVRAILAAVTKPSAEAAKLAESLGINFNTAGLEAQGLAGFMEEIAAKTGGSNEQLALLFGGVEAIIPAMALAGSSGEYLAEILDEMGVKSGATAEAFRLVADSLDFRMKAALGQFGVLATTAGEAMLAVLVPALEAAAVAATFLADNFDYLMAGAGGLAAVLAGRLVASLALTSAQLAIVGARAIWAGVSGFAVLASNIGLSAAASATASLAIGGLSGALGVLKAAIMTTGFGVLVVGAGYLVYEFTRLVKATGGFGEALTVLGTVAEGVWRGIQLSAMAIPSVLQTVWNEMKADFFSALSTMAQGWANLLSNIHEGLGNLGIVGRALIPGANAAYAAVGALGPAAKKAAGDLSNLASEAQNAGASAEGVAVAYSAAADATINSAWNTLRNTINSTSDAMEGGVPPAVEIGDALGGASDALDSAGSSAGGASDKVDDLADRLETLRGQLDPAWKAAQDYAKAQNTLTQALDAGLISQAEFNDLMGEAKERMDEATGAASKYGKQVSGIFAEFLTGETDLPGLWDRFKSLGVNAFTDILTESFAPDGDGIRGVMDGLSKAFSGVMGNLGSGNIMGAIGSAMPIIGAVVSAINLIRGFHQSQVVGAGVTGSIGANSQARDFETTQHSWLWGLFTTIEETETANSKLTALLTENAASVRGSVAELVEGMGGAASDLSSIVHEFKIDTRDMSADEVKEALSSHMEAYSDLVAQAALGSEEFLRAGESYLDALKRMAGALPTVNAALETMGHTMFNISLVGADAASALAELFGGVQNFAQSANFVFQRFYREGERFDLLMAKLTGDLADMGLEMPKTREEYRLLLESQALMTEKGRENYAALMQMAGSFDVVLPKLRDFTAELSNMGDELGRSLKSAIRSAGQAADEFESLFESIIDMARDIRASVRGQSAISDNAMDDFRRAYAKAMGGDQDAMRSIGRLGEDAVSSFAQVAGSAAEYRLFTSRVANQVQNVAGLAAGLSVMKTIEERTLEEILKLVQSGELTTELLDESIAKIVKMNDSFIAGLGDTNSTFVSSLGGVSSDLVDSLSNLNVETINALYDLNEGFKTAIETGDSPVVDAIWGSTTDLVSELVRVRASVHDLAIQRAQASGDEGQEQDALANQIAQMQAEGASVADKISGISIPDKIRIVDSKGVWLGASWAKTSDGQTFREKGYFNTSNELKAVMNKARGYADTLNAKRDQKLSQRTSLQSRLDLLREQIRSMGGTPSFAGGGFTGMGPRSGGLDGQGGFNAMLHPRETVIDHTRHPLHDPEMLREMRETRREIAALREEQRQLGVQTLRHTRKTSQNIDKWDQIGLPQEQT